MTQKNNRAGSSARSAMAGMMPTEMIEKGVEAASKMQQELLGTIEQANRDWLARMEAERDLAAELTRKLTAARSPADAAAAYQEWMSRRVQLMSEDSRKFVADCQKFFDATMRTVANSRPGSA